MSKKTSKLSENISNHPARWAVISIAVWAVLLNVLFVLTNFVFVNALMLMLGFTLIYPVCTLALCFYYAKRCGIRWYMPFGIIPIIAVEFIALENLRAVIPNVLVSTGFCMLFGSGVGNIFADKDFIQIQKKQQRDKKLHEDIKYKKILDDKRGK